MLSGCADIADQAGRNEDEEELHYAQDRVGYGPHDEGSRQQKLFAIRGCFRVLLSPGEVERERSSVP